MRRLLRILAVATLAAGLVGALRQRAEAMAVRRGERPAVNAASVTPPPYYEEPIGAALARWVPQAPASLPGRMAAAIWASPLTVLGLAVGLTSGGRPRWDATQGCVVFDGAHTGSAWLLRAVGAGANAIGQVVVSRYDPTPPVLLAHEAGHVRQAEHLGALLAPAYLWLSAIYGYRNHPLERSARAAARRWLGDTHAV